MLYFSIYENQLSNLLKLEKISEFV